MDNEVYISVFKRRRNYYALVLADPEIGSYMLPYWSSQDKLRRFFLDGLGSSMSDKLVGFWLSMEPTITRATMQELTDMQDKLIAFRYEWFTKKMVAMKIHRRYNSLLQANEESILLRTIITTT